VVGEAPADPRHAAGGVVIVTPQGLREFASVIDSRLVLAFYRNAVEVRLYSDIPGQQRRWKQLGTVRQEDLYDWLRGYAAGRRHR